jgi:lipopolysaccharide biosynthesis glycosyltransferase
LFHISDGKTIPLWYNTSAWERFLRSESDFHTEFRGEVYRASDVDTMLSGEIKQLLQLQEKVEKINLVKDEGKKGYKNQDHETPTIKLNQATKNSLVLMKKNRHAKNLHWYLIQQMSKKRFSMISSAINYIGMPNILNIVG